MSHWYSFKLEDRKVIVCARRQNEVMKLVDDLIPTGCVAKSKIDEIRWTREYEIYSNPGELRKQVNKLH